MQQFTDEQLAYLLDSQTANDQKWLDFSERIIIFKQIFSVPEMEFEPNTLKEIY